MRPLGRVGKVDLMVQLEMASECKKECGMAMESKRTDLTESENTLV